MQWLADQPLGSVSLGTDDVVIGFFKKGDDLLTRDARKTIEKFFEGIAAFEVV